MRDAREDFVAILKESGFPEEGPTPVKACVHCFTGDTEELKEYVKMGFYIGLTGFIINNNMSEVAEEGGKGEKEGESLLSEWLQIIPDDKLVIETDAPYMGFKGCRKTESKKKNQKYPNIPSALNTVCQTIADASGREYDTVASVTTTNALDFFACSKD